MKKSSNIIGIKARSMPGILGANKYYKSDWRLVAYLIPRQALEDTRTKFTEPELLHNSIYFLVGNQDGDSLHRFSGRQVCFPLALKVHRKSMVFS